MPCYAMLGLVEEKPGLLEEMLGLVEDMLDLVEDMRGLVEAIRFPPTVTLLLVGRPPPRAPASGRPRGRCSELLALIRVKQRQELPREGDLPVERLVRPLEHGPEGPWRRRTCRLGTP